MVLGAKYTVIMEAPVSPISLTCLPGRTLLVSFCSERLWMMLASKKPSHLLSLMLHDNETCPDPPVLLQFVRRRAYSQRSTQVPSRPHFWRRKRSCRK